MMNIVARESDGKETTICNTEEQMESLTVLQLKEKIEERLQIPVLDIRVVFEGRQLEDSLLLSDYGIKHMSVIHVVRRLRGGGQMKGDGGMGDKKGKNRSRESVLSF